MHNSKAESKAEKAGESKRREMERWCRRDVKDRIRLIFFVQIPDQILIGVIVGESGPRPAPGKQPGLSYRLRERAGSGDISHDGGEDKHENALSEWKRSLVSECSL